MKRTALFVTLALAAGAPAFAQHAHPAPAAQPAAAAAADPHAHHAQSPAPSPSPAPAPAPGQPGAPAAPAPGGPPMGQANQPPPIDVPWNDALPAGTAAHAARALKESTRKGEWVDIKLADGTALKSWVVYPSSSAKTGVVVVIHDIRGMADIPRAVGDQLAQDGFIAIVPDFLSGKGPNGGGTESLGSEVGQAIRTLTPAEVNARLDAAMAYGKTLKQSNGKTGVTGFCWGGARTFGYAAHQKDLQAAVVFYGDAPGSADSTQEAALANVAAPVIGMYAGNDARINATIPATEAAMKKLGKKYEVHTFDGAGHGFVGNQAGANGANLKATQNAWPMLVTFFNKQLK
jgi:carboxymethylenebutenolidase